MARNISTQALNTLAQSHGVEPIIIVEVQWLAEGDYTRYSTHDIPGSKAKLLDVSAIDSAVAISLNDSSEEFDLIIDDTDGSIKTIIDTNDIHLRDVKVYQWFRNLAFSDRFIIFQGKINSPITWSETDRTVKFSVVSQLEDKDVGFSPEEGTFPDLPDDMIGKLWPECFGTSVHQKAIQVDFKYSGSLGESVGLRDFTIPSRQAALNLISNYLTSLGVLYSTAAGFAGVLGLVEAQESLESKANNFFAQAGQKNEEIADLALILASQAATEKDSFRVIGGAEFPRGSLKLQINEAVFTGSFVDDVFHVSCADHPEAKNFYPNQTPCGNPTECTNQGGCKTFPNTEGFSITQANGSGQFIPTGNILGDQAGAFFAQGGAAVTIYSKEPLRYFVSITPGKVLKVAAFTTFEGGEKVLVDVPTNLYTTYTQNYSGVNVKVVRLHDALSKQDPPWEDTIYVTYQSSVGPNPISIMKYLINKYSSVPIDKASFNKCQSALENYPMHFCLTKKSNIVTVLRELAFMARVALTIKNGRFFCRYLAERPKSEFTFNESNVLSQSVELGFTDTEELVTKYIAKWRSHGAQDEDNNAVVAYNVKKYGIHEEELDFYAYNYPSAIIKSLTFWINRRAHTWKKLRFKTALDALNVEAFDGVTLDFANNYHANESTLGYVEEGTYNPSDNTLDFNVWTGVRAGDMTEYDLAYPQNISTSLTFPDEVATASGFAGRDGPANTSSGNIFRYGQKQGVNVTYTPSEADIDNEEAKRQAEDPFNYGVQAKQDVGGGKISDVDDKKPGNPTTNATGQTTTGSPPPATPGINSGTINTPGETFWIDIRTTQVADSANPGQVTTFSTFFKEVTGGTLKGSTASTWTDGSEEGEFDFKFDTEGAKFGAGTAFLKD